MSKSPLLLIPLLVLANCGGQADPLEDLEAAPLTGESELLAVRSDWLWTERGKVVPMCWDNYRIEKSFTSPAERAALKSFVMERVALSWEYVLDIDVTWQDCPTSGTEKHVRVELIRQPMDPLTGRGDSFGMATIGVTALTTPEQRASALRPNVDPNSVNPVFRLNVSETWNLDRLTRLELQQVILHEMGHTLGFHHEQLRNDETADEPGEGCVGEDDSGFGVPYGAYDSLSIMSASYCHGGVWLSYADMQNARSVYGTAPAKPNGLSTILSSGSGATVLNVMHGRDTQRFYILPDPAYWETLGGADFDGDGWGDVLRRRKTDGVLQVVLISPVGGIKAIGYPTTSGGGPMIYAASWKFVGTGRFNSDAKSDVAWIKVNPTTGKSELFIHYMSGGGALIGQSGVFTADKGWVVKAVGDFDKNGVTDIYWNYEDPFYWNAEQLWNNQSRTSYFWFMNGAGGILSSGYGQNVAAGFQVTGAGDFNGDGRDELFMQGANNGAITYVTSRSPIATTTHTLSYVDTGWRVSAIGDFNRDGKSDLYWIKGTNEARIWYQNGSYLLDNVVAERKDNVKAVLQAPTLPIQY